MDFNFIQNLFLHKKTNILFKKSFQHKTLKQTKFDDLWNRKGVFTTIRVIGKSRSLLFFNDHLKKLNKSINLQGIKIFIAKKDINFIIKSLFQKNIYYNHLLRIAVTKKIISFSLRKREKINKKFIGILINYKRKNWELKHLKYNKILSHLNNIDRSCSEIILTKNNILLEGATTNLLCVSKGKIYIPYNGYYSGVTLNFFLKNSKRSIIKANITKKNLSDFDEIILVGSGKGVVSVDNIPQLHWSKTQNTVFKEFQALYKSYIKKQIVT